jgi:hypothetical protein
LFNRQNWDALKNWDNWVEKRYPIGARDGQRIVVQRLRNLTNSRLSTQIATRCRTAPEFPTLDPFWYWLTAVPSHPRRILSADVVLTSADRPILPLNLKFSVFDLRTGMVLFHSDNERVLIEDVFRDLADAQDVVAAARVRKADGFWADYRGERSWFAFEPMPTLDWGVIVYAPSEPVDALFYASVLTAIGLSLLYLLVLAGLLQAWLWVSGRQWLGGMRAAALFWPQWRLRRVYLPLTFLLLAIGFGSGAWAAQMPSPPLALLLLLLLTLLCLVSSLSPNGQISRPLAEGRIAVWLSPILIRLSGPNRSWFRITTGLACLLGIVGLAIWSLISAQAGALPQVRSFLLLVLPLIAIWLFAFRSASPPGRGLDANPWRQTLEWAGPTWLVRSVQWLGGQSDTQWSAFSFRYCAFLSALCFVFAAAPGWSLCQLAYENWRMDTELFLEKTTQNQRKLRYEHLVQQKNELVGPPFKPSMFDAMQERWQQGIHPLCSKEASDPACHFAFKQQINGDASEQNLGRLIWPASAEQAVLPLAPEMTDRAQRRVSPAEASGLLRLFKQWFVPNHPVPQAIAVSAVDRIYQHEIARGPGSWKNVYGDLAIAYQLPNLQELRQLRADTKDVHDRRAIVPVTLVMSGLALFGLFWLLDAQLFGSRLLWSGRLGPISPPEPRSFDQVSRCLLMVRPSTGQKEAIVHSDSAANPAPQVIDCVRELNPQFSVHASIWIDGLDEAIRADTETRQRVLTLLESLVAKPAGGSVWVVTDSPPLHFISRPEAYPPSAALPEPPGVAERLRWARLFSVFVKCYPVTSSDDTCASARLLAMNVDRNIAELIDRETRLFWPQFLFLRKRLLLACGDSSTWDKPLNERDVVEAVEMASGALMRRHWETLTTQERLTLKQLADGNYANPANRLALMHLLRRGLVVSEPHLKVKTEALRLFVLAAETQGQYDAWAQQTPESAWYRFRTPILVGLVLVLVITGWVTREATQLFAGLLAAVSGALGLLGKGSGGGGKADLPK